MIPQRKHNPTLKDHNFEMVNHKKNEGKSKKFKYVIGVGLAFIIGLTVLSRFVHIVELKYQLEGLRREYSQESRINSDIKLQVADLKSLERIHTIATEEIGMIKPDNDNIVFVEKENKNEGAFITSRN